MSMQPMTQADAVTQNPDYVYLKRENIGKVRTFY